MIERSSSQFSLVSERNSSHHRVLVITYIKIRKVLILRLVISLILTDIMKKFYFNTVMSIYTSSLLSVDIFAMRSYISLQDNVQY